MQHINDKRELHKTVIGAIIFISMILYFRYQTAKQYINRSIKVISNIYTQIIYYMNEVFAIINKMHLELSKIFNNRELAIGFWLIIFILFCLSIKSDREQLPNIIKSLFGMKLMIWWVCMVLYFLGTILILIKLGFWNISLLKNTIIWFITVGILLSAKAIGTAKDLKYFVNIIKDNIKLLIIIAFVSDLYSFSFIGEVILIFAIMFISILLVLVKLKPLKTFLNVALSVIGFYILYNSIRLLSINIQIIDTRELVKQMLLPTILSIMFTFFMYFFAIYSNYEHVIDIFFK